jgi:hypothetical protein
MLKIIIMIYLYIKKNYKVINDKNYEITHSCIVSNKGDYIRDITNLVKMHNVSPKTKIQFFKSLIKDTNVVVYVYFNGDDIEIKYIL